jgi:hypothetical protein
VTTFSYTPGQMRKTEAKPNGNTVTYNYFADQQQHPRLPRLQRTHQQRRRV